VALLPLLLLLQHWESLECVLDELELAGPTDISKCQHQHQHQHRLEWTEQSMEINQQRRA
jgi:hypothetical protein